MWLRFQGHYIIGGEVYMTISILVGIIFLVLAYLACICYAFFVFHKAQMKYNDGKWFS